MAMALPGNVRPFFEPYEAAIEAQEARAEYDALVTEAEIEPELEPESEVEERLEGETDPFPALATSHTEPREIQSQD